MTRLDDVPAELPRPVDDGACDHLRGMAMPAVALPSTEGGVVRLDRLPPGRTVIYCYPMTGVPGQPLPADWDAIPGARGCTPQSCAFRDHHAELLRLGAGVFGLSTQTTAYQREMAERLHLPFAVLSDAELQLATALQLPTFAIEPDGENKGQGQRLIRRLTFVVRDGSIEHVFYPVFPPGENAATVVGWLERATR